MSTISVDIPVLEPAQERRARGDSPRQTQAIARPARNPMLDAARVFAALGLVWVHTTQSSLSRFHLIGRFSTSFFIIAAIFFLFYPLGSSPRLSYGAYALKRFRRLYIPFAAWSLIYLLVRDVKRMLIHEPALTLHWSRLVAGTSMQFWFLPFILIACLICYPMPPLFERMGKARYLLLPLFLAAGIAIGLSSRPGVEGSDEVTNYFLDSSWTFAPSIFWALTLVILFPLLPTALRGSRVLAIVGLALTASCILYLWSIRNSANPMPSLPRTLAGVGVLLAVLVPYRGKLVMLMAPLGKYSYGIFLVHPIFVSSLQSFTRYMHLSPAAWLDLFVLIVAFTASALFTVLLGSNRWTLWLVP